MSTVDATSQIAAAGHMLERARWANQAFATYTAAEVARITRAVAEAAHARAGHYAEWAVRETGFGVVEHKKLKNESCSTGIVDDYSGDDFVTPRIDRDRKIVEIPRPAGVILALTPSTNPVATLYFKVILALLTRNAVIVSPHPMAKECCADAAQYLAGVAVDAGAPDGIIQVVTDPTIPLVEALMADDRTNVILATGGTGVVRAAYSSGNPAIGVGPGNVPVLVDSSADISAAATAIVESTAFDNSVLCTSESVLVAEQSILAKLTRAMEQAGAVFLDRPSTQRLSAYMYPYGRLNAEVIGKAAHIIAAGAGLRVGEKSRILVAPFEVAVPEEPMTHEKLSPVLGLISAPTASQGTEIARAVVRVGGAGHSAAIHSNDPVAVMRYASRVPVLRIAVNVGNSLGSSGFETGLAATMTIGTGFVGRSSLGENLQPKHLVNWTRIAYNSDARVGMPSFEDLTSSRPHEGPVPPYPLASNNMSLDTTDGRSRTDLLQAAEALSGSISGTDRDDFRKVIKQLVIDELSQLLKD